jgi:DNA-binding transcriptional ArsR family regulator
MDIYRITHFLEQRRRYIRKILYIRFFLYTPPAAGDGSLNEVASMEMVRVLKALSNPIRLKMIASLNSEPKNVYALAKELGLPYPLAHLHLNGLKKLGLVREIREEKKVEGLPTVKYYSPADFKFVLTPQNIEDLYKKGKEAE